MVGKNSLFVTNEMQQSPPKQKSMAQKKIAQGTSIVNRSLFWTITVKTVSRYLFPATTHGSTDHFSEKNNGQASLSGNLAVAAISNRPTCYLYISALSSFTLASFMYSSKVIKRSMMPLGVSSMILLATVCKKV